MTSTASKSMMGNRVKKKTTALGRTRELQPPLQKPRSVLVSRMSVPICTRNGGTASTANPCTFFRRPCIHSLIKRKSSVAPRGGVRCSPPVAMHGSRSLVHSRFVLFVGVFSPFSCCFASFGSSFHFLQASTFQQERGLSVCVRPAVHIYSFLLLG